MAELEALRRRIGTAEDLQSVVKTMKGLAAVSIRQYERAVQSLAVYSRTIELGLQVVLKKTDNLQSRRNSVSPGSNLACIVIGSDQGMCGQFNEQLSTYLRKSLADRACSLSDLRLLVVGTRMFSRIMDLEVKERESYGLPSSLSVFRPTLEAMVERINYWTFSHGVERVWLVYNRHAKGGRSVPGLLELLPLDALWMESIKSRPWGSRMLPSFSEDVGTLFASLVRQYLFVSLYRGLAESMAAENAARLTAMQAAEKNVEERLQELQGDYHRERQMAITEELLDIVGGFEALADC